MKTNKLSALVGGIISEVRTHWNTPAKKKYVSYKEMAAYGLGGMGVQFIACTIGLIALNASSMLVGASIGIKIVDMQTINVITTLLGIITAPTRAMIFDNTKSKMGKFRPYLLYMGLPSALLYMLFVYMPYENMDYTGKFIAVLVIYNLIQFCSPFYVTAYNSMPQVMSPDTNERSWIIQISSCIYSFAPTIINFLMPLIGPLDKIGTYRISAPFFCITGLVMGMFCVFGTKEKVIVPKRYVPKVGFIDGMKKVFKNKYFWIIYGSQWLAFFTAGYAYLFQWIFYYGMNNPGLFSILTVVRGCAYIPGMWLAAPIINKFGKKNVCLFSMAAQTVCIAAMLLCFDNFVLAFLMLFLKEAFSAVSVIYTPAMKADVIDYQQFKTNDRLEGFIEQIGGLMGGLIGLGTGYIIPYILSLQGLTNNFEDLYQESFRNPLVQSMLILSIIGMIMSAVPFLFYNLSETKRGGMIKVLKLRALISDYVNGDANEENLVETVGEISEEVEFFEANKNNKITDKKEKEKFEAAKLVYLELHKFENSEVVKKVKAARHYVSQRSDVKEPDIKKVEDAMNLPDETRSERKLRNRAIKSAEKEMKDFERKEKSYVAAKKLLAESDSYSKWEKIQKEYERLTAYTAKQ